MIKQSLFDKISGMKINEHLSKSSNSRAFWVIIGFLLFALLWLIDYLTIADLSFLVFYLIPIFLITWFGRKWLGFLMALLSGIAWFTADELMHSFVSQPFVPYGNLLAQLILFLVFSHLLSILKDTLAYEKELARTDPLTGIANSRYFQELTDIHLSLANRYQRSITLAYLDIDDFKRLTTVSAIASEIMFYSLLRKRLRKTFVPVM